MLLPSGASFEDMEVKFYEAWFATGAPCVPVTSTACPSEMFYSEEAGKSGGGALSANKQVVPSGFKTITRLLWNKFIRQKNNRKKYLWESAH